MYRSLVRSKKNGVSVKSDLYNIAYLRHISGQLHRWILPLLTSGEMFFQVGLEEQVNRQYLIRSLEVTRPLRQILYGIVFSISDIIHKSYRKNAAAEPILIREWYPCRSKPEFVQDAVFYRSVGSFGRKFDRLNYFLNELHIILKRRNLEICEHSSF